ncbi:hypothetical protein FOVSG1_014887 [Fusarium oxysporum f. sp. vasinfectum]
MARADVTRASAPVNGRLRCAVSRFSALSSAHPRSWRPAVDLPPVVVYDRDQFQYRLGPFGKSNLQCLGLWNFPKGYRRVAHPKFDATAGFQASDFVDSYLWTQETCRILSNFIGMNCRPARSEGQVNEVLNWLYDPNLSAAFGLCLSKSSTIGPRVDEFVVEVKLSCTQLALSILPVRIDAVDCFLVKRVKNRITATPVAPELLVPSSFGKAKLKQQQDTFSFAIKSPEQFFHIVFLP